MPSEPAALTAGRGTADRHRKDAFMLGLKARDLPGRVATGAYVLHTGLEKWKGDEARAKALHSMVGIGLGMVVGALTDSEKTSG